MHLLHAQSINTYLVPSRERSHGVDESGIGFGWLADSGRLAQERTPAPGARRRVDESRSARRWPLRIAIGWDKPAEARADVIQQQTR